MITIKHNKVKYALPEDWSEVTFRQFKELDKLDKQELGQLEKIGRMVAVFIGVSYDSLADNPDLIFKIWNNLNFLYTPVEEIPPAMHFNFKGETFFVRHLNNVSYRELSDYQTIEAIFRGDVEGITRKLAVLCRKSDEMPLRSTEDIEARAEFFEDLDFRTVLSINNFFLKSQQLLREATLRYSELEKLVKEKEQKLRDSMTVSGVGGRLRTKWRHLLLNWSLFIVRRLPTSWFTRNMK